MSLAVLGMTFGYTVFVWWFSTGAIVWLDRRPQHTHGLSFALVTCIAAAALAGVFASLDDHTPTGAVLGFTSAVGLWGWHEASFLMGGVTGPRVAPCPPDARLGQRFKLATATLIYHEAALVVTLVFLGIVISGHANTVALWTFALLFVARLSAKLNLFFGVPNFSLEFFPPRLAYLATYLGKAKRNAVFPVSVAAGLLALWLEVRMVSAASASAADVVGGSLVMALTALALLEHGFMVAPIPDAALWRWALSSHRKTAGAPTLDL